jgi:cysteinyl-tRNA synthetase
MGFRLWLLRPVVKALENVSQRLFGLDGLVRRNLADTETNIRKMEEMSEALNRLIGEVADLKTVAASTLKLLDSLESEIRANAGDEAKMTALADDLDVVKSDLANAVRDNTTAESEPGANEPAADTQAGGDGSDTQAGG